MKRSLLLTTLFTLFTFICFGQTSTSKFIGKWNFSISNVPYGYDKGTITIHPKQDTIMAMIEFPYEKITDAIFTENDGKGVFSIDIDGEKITIELSTEKDKTIANIYSNYTGHIKTTLNKVKQTSTND